MNYICDNPACGLHVQLPPSCGEDAPVVWVPVDPPPGSREPYRSMTVRRHLYRSRLFGNDWYLCDTCHSAVSFVMGKK